MRSWTIGITATNVLRLQRGFTLLELIVGMALSTTLLLSVAQTFSVLTKSSHDQKLRTLAQLQAQAVVDFMAPELRMIGNGVPFHQSNFLIAQADLSDNTVTQPILVAGTTATQIQFRLNQTGETYIVTSDFDPSSATSVTLTSVDKIFAGDEVYITNSTVGADDGFWGEVQAVDPTNRIVTFVAGAQYSPGKTFAKGSLLEVVPVITFNSADDFGGITRDDGTGAVSLITNGQFSLEFLNMESDVLTLPLEASADDPYPASSIQNVRAIRVTVQVQAESTLSNGETYIATAVQSVGIRNLNFKY